ncbi:chromosome segregation protein SMC [Candidatus Omnitrophota bacterium]
MYLKRLELFGFKSFANKTELVFEPGVTAIVGPNGCGKSNISDAIKWVLGEQSAKELRGAKMEDIIFNGTENAQPVNLAEVSLVFSNQSRTLAVDYDEVRITRRVFRSGESEYLLNKTQVRLKDIVAILAGTGIGVSSYSIAEQGKMDRVLHARPEDRREIFEEASGITKFKTKKKEAMNKLESTENNLIRIADIVNEVKRQIASIERQANKAEKFRIEFERLKEMDLKLALHDYNDIRNIESKVGKESGDLKQREGHLSLELNVQQDELRIHREKINGLDAKIAETRLKISDVTNNIDKNENSVKIGNERIDELASRSQSLSREIEETERRASELKEKINAVESEFNLINEEKEGKQQLLADTDNNLNQITQAIRECEKAISESKVAIMDNASQQTKIRNDLNKVSSSITTASSRHRRLNIEKENILKEKESFENTLRIAEDGFTKQKVNLERILSQVSSLKDAFQQLERNIKEKASLIEKLKQRLSSSNSKLELLKDLKEKKEGFSEGVKSYLELIDSDPVAKDSFVGIVADMIKPAQGFVRALESALGEKSQAIVVRSRDAVNEGLSYLKREGKGRAQFISLDELSLQSRPGYDQEPPIGSRGLNDFVSVVDEHKAVVEYILGNIYLVDNIESCLELRDPSRTLVTRDGDLTAGFITAGGSSGQDEYTSIIGRDAKIGELTQETRRIEAEIGEYESEHTRMVSRFSDIGNGLKMLEETAKQEEITLSVRGSEKNKIAEDLKKLSEESELIVLELDEVSDEEGELKSREENLNADLEKIDEERQRIESIIAESQITIADKRSEKERVIISLTEIRTQMELVSDKFNSQQAALDMMKDSCGNEESAVVDRRNQLQESKNKSLSIKADNERLEEESRVLKSQIEIVDRELDELKEERRVAYTLVEEVDKKTREKQKELDEMRSTISSFHINMNDLGYKASGIKERMSQSYKIDIDEEAMVFEGSEDWSAIGAEVEELKEKLDKMGPVNLVAIEEHKELQDRFEFLTAQYQDLMTAKESLHKAINKINRTTRQMFIETFDQIKVCFKEYFKLLFGGGTAELFLTDQTDILESGIDMVVRPPGKKLQSISLLSGGEKALTSVALLFSLFKVKPTPFCILDEIDAPLDEANIDRFSRMLQEFIKSTQFIIITHNKKTISISDIMYGITMEKSGISKIVSVKFADGQLPHKPQEIIKSPPKLKEPEEEKVNEEDTSVAEPVADETTS